MELLIFSPDCSRTCTRDIMCMSSGGVLRHPKTSYAGIKEWILNSEVQSLPIINNCFCWNWTYFAYQSQQRQARYSCWKAQQVIKLRHPEVCYRTFWKSVPISNHQCIRSLHDVWAKVLIVPDSQSVETTAIKLTNVQHQLAHSKTWYPTLKANVIQPKGQI